MKYSKEMVQSIIAKSMVQVLKEGGDYVCIVPRDWIWAKVTPEGESSLLRVNCRDYDFDAIEGARELDSFWANIVTEFKKRSERLIRGRKVQYNWREVSDRCYWYERNNYRALSSVEIVKPCKEFFKLLKKVEQVCDGANSIDPFMWGTDRVFGKRSSYSVCKRELSCLDSVMCEKVLAYLKGKRKAIIEIRKVEHLEDREYGERFETEWSGSIDYRLAVSTSEGMKLF